MTLIWMAVTRKKEEEEEGRGGQLALPIATWVGRAFGDGAFLWRERERAGFVAEGKRKTNFVMSRKKKNKTFGWTDGILQALFLYVC